MAIDNLLQDSINFFKIYHPGSRGAVPATSGSGNSPIALIAIGVIILVIIILIIYFRKKYKQKYRF